MHHVVVYRTVYPDGSERFNAALDREVGHSFVSLEELAKSVFETGKMVAPNQPRLEIRFRVPGEDLILLPLNPIETPLLDLSLNEVQKEQLYAHLCGLVLAWKDRQEV